MNKNLYSLGLMSGTSMDGIDLSIIKSDGELKTSMYTFESAWGPPQEGIQHISKSFKPLLFDLRYQEPGMMFCGYARIGNGEVLHEQSAELVLDAEMIYQCIDWDYESDMKKETLESSG